MPDLHDIRVFRKVKIQNCLFQKLNVSLAVEVDQSLKNMVRDDLMLQSTREDESVKSLEVPLLHPCLGEHLEQLPKEVVDSTDSDAELCGDTQGSLRDALPLLEFFDAGVNVLAQKIFHPLT